MPAVQPLDPEAFARALVRELERRRGLHRATVQVNLDRRRFTDQVDVAYTFGGSW
jgi:hypothetical protein